MSYLHLISTREVLPRIGYNVTNITFWLNTPIFPLPIKNEDEGNLNFNVFPPGGN